MGFLLVLTAVITFYTLLFWSAEKFNRQAERKSTIKRAVAVH
jgi:hypothetical protein